MDFSSWQTWGLLIVGGIFLLGIIGTLSDAISGKKGSAKPAPRPPSNAAAQVATLAAVTTYASRFDRDMYIDDMTASQLEYEHVWHTAFITAYNIVWNLGPAQNNPIEDICTAITGHPADRQLTGLTEYYFETVYEPMMGEGNDRYWDEELIARKDQWTAQRREQILLAALVPLQMASELHQAIRGQPPSSAQPGAHLYPFIDKVAEAFFGAETPDRMASLREQAKSYAASIEL